MQQGNIKKQRNIRKWQQRRNQGACGNSVPFKVSVPKNIQLQFKDWVLFENKVMRISNKCYKMNIQNPNSEFNIWYCDLQPIDNKWHPSKHGYKVCDSTVENIAVEIYRRYNTPS